MAFAVEYAGVSYPHNPTTGQPWDSQEESEAFLAALIASMVPAEPAPPPKRTDRPRRPVDKKEFVDFFTNAMLVQSDASGNTDMKGLWIRMGQVTRIVHNHPQTVGALALFQGLITGVDAPYIRALMELWPRDNEMPGVNAAPGYTQIMELADAIRTADPSPATNEQVAYWANEVLNLPEGS